MPSGITKKTRYQLASEMSQSDCFIGVLNKKTGKFFAAQAIPEKGIINLLLFLSGYAFQGTKDDVESSFTNDIDEENLETCEEGLGEMRMEGFCYSIFFFVSFEHTLATRRLL
jgi:hypothetical protein